MSPAVQYYDPVQAEQAKVDAMNAEVGTLKFIDCPKCKNKGVIYRLDVNGVVSVEICECQSKRDSIERIKKSGLETLMKEYTFDSYQDTEPWQKAIKKKATAYLDDNHKKWFYIGGQVGCGKTFICTAITTELINRGKQAIYMLWRDEVVPLKANVNDSSEYGTRKQS